MFLVMFVTFTNTVVELNSWCLCSLRGWSLYMAPVHLHLKVQYTWKLEPICTTGLELNQMEQDFMPGSRNHNLYAAAYRIRMRM